MGVFAYLQLKRELSHGGKTSLLLNDGGRIVSIALEIFYYNVLHSFRCVELRVQGFRFFCL